MGDLNVVYVGRRGEHFWFVFDDDHYDELIQKALWFTRRKTLSFDRNDFYKLVASMACLDSHVPEQEEREP